MKIKLYSNQVRQKIRMQSGVVPYRFTDEGIEILIIKHGTGKWWGLPKGGIEPNMTATDSAAKEAYEEGGISGKVKNIVLATFQYEKGGRPQHVQMFPMKVTKVYSKYLEAKTRKRKWVSPEVAFSKVRPYFRKSITKLLKILEHTH